VPDPPLSGPPGHGRLARIVGLDRSGPTPRETLPSEPLRPWTIPNLIGFLRLALVPVFLVVALSSSDGTGPAPAILFAAIAFGDYLDGFTARLTGQYSRLGALMDPLTDRLLVISGVVVCWRFELLPRWALALLAARELATIALARYAQTRSLELRINWPGRIAVALLMAALFFALTGLDTLPDVFLYVGLLLALLATGLYVRTGVLQLRARRPPTGGPEHASRPPPPPSSSALR
jgi:CDP-diacylglycerol--glycerol-3-phosphate 3-phosphatidyltransferase